MAALWIRREAQKAVRGREREREREIDREKAGEATILLCHALQEAMRKLVRVLIATGADDAAPHPQVSGLYMNAVNKKIAAEVDKNTQMPSVLCSPHPRRIPSATCQLSATTVITMAVAI